MFLGEDLLPLLVLAFGAAMAVGSGLALLRPPPEGAERPPLARTLVMIAVGAVAALWALGSLVGGS